ncbi:hypothetical protein [Taibaiella koreensis]|uniref:hypothetical protein n=1 Tax=Taibaiella koreensis TaxID=1268548 RepID=UPI0013C2BD79|nr:hypothetical protein [Taibaiella koreensis]
MLNSKNDRFFNVLFSNNKIINYKDNSEKNISEELLTIRTLVFCRPLENVPEETEQLEKILIACKLQKEAYKVVQNVHSWSFYRKIENIKEILLFGITEKDLNLNILFTENQINKFDNRIFIKTASLATLLSNQQIKNDLWQNALKIHFLS